MKKAIVPAAFFIYLASAINVPAAEICRDDSSAQTAPSTISQLHNGMLKEQVERIVGSSAYNPTDSIFYYETDGECVSPDEWPASCGYVVGYADGAMDSCWWGPIRE